MTVFQTSTWQANPGPIGLSWDPNDPSLPSTGEASYDDRACRPLCFRNRRDGELAAGPRVDRIVCLNRSLCASEEKTQLLSQLSYEIRGEVPDAALTLPP